MAAPHVSQVTLEKMFENNGHVYGYSPGADNSWESIVLYKHNYVATLVDAVSLPIK